jgi:hypothetical protein
LRLYAFAVKIANPCSLGFYWIFANSCSSTIVLLAFAVNVPWIYLCLLLTDEYKMVSISGCWGRSFWKLLVFLQLFELPPWWNPAGEMQME